MNRKSKKLWKRISSIVSGLFLVLILFILVVTVIQRIRGEVSIAGYRFLTVLTGSMEPAIKTGSLIIVTQNAKDIKAGDIITFQVKGDSHVLVTHRVYKVEDNANRYLTKGDANNVQDENAVEADAVVGKLVMSIPFVGFCMNFLARPANLFLLVVSALLIACIREYIIRSWTENKSLHAHERSNKNVKENKE